MSAFKTVRGSVLLSLLVVVALLGTLVFAVAPAMAEFGVERFALSVRNANGTPDVQAGSHPYALNATIILKEPGALTGSLKDARVELPPGLVGNPDATPKCTYQEFIRQVRGGPEKGQCPNETAVGVATFYQQSETDRSEAEASSSAVYNLVPPAGVVAEFGYVGAGYTPVLLEESVRTGSDYGVTTTVPDINDAVNIYASKVTLWGTPAAAVHNDWRGSCVETKAGGSYPVAREFGLSESEDELEGPLLQRGGEPEGLPISTGVCETGDALRPLLTLPTSCGRPLTGTVSVDSWQEPGDFVGAEHQRTKSVSLPELSGCEGLTAGFDPKVIVRPEKSTGSTPSGVEVSESVPQEGLEDPDGLADADVKGTTVVFPAGMQLNASAVNGLQGCSVGEIGYTGMAELDAATEPGVLTPQFEERVTNPSSGRPVADLCPDASKVANVRIKTPLLEGELVGSIYLASPQNFMAGVQENPFGSLTAFYGVAEEPRTGVLVKFPGNLERNPVTGQMTGTIENLPQTPFSEAHLDFYGGERASFATPAQCGTYVAQASVAPWSAPPASPPVSVGATSEFNVTSGPGGTGCAPNPLAFTPSVTSGGISVDAGGFSPLSTVVDRADGDQAIKDVTLTYPPGVSAVLTGVPECPEAQANAGACGAESLIGEDTANVGLGNDPYTVTGGKIYLTGPYEGAPFGLSIVTPTRAGPFVLEEGRPVITRAKIEINPVTAAVTVTTGEIPHILDGIQLQVKQIYANINRPDFAINPTSCEKMSVSGSVGGWEGASSLVSDPFQVVDCEHLAFAPKFSASTQGNGKTQGDGASLDVKIATKQGPGVKAGEEEANLAKVDVTLPLALSSRLKVLQKACLETQFAANPAGCPPGSMVGSVTASTPILPVPLTGPAIIVSHGGRAFPDLDFVLQGDGVEIIVTGNTQIKGGITNTKFESAPDAPISSFEVNLPEKENAILGAIKNLCAPTKTVTVKKKVTVKRHGKLVKVTKKVAETTPEALIMPTKMTGQNGATFDQETKISVTGCAKAKVVKKAAKKHKKAKKGGKR
jgi:hypothetical protein